MGKIKADQHALRNTGCSGRQETSKMTSKLKWLTQSKIFKVDLIFIHVLTPIGVQEKESSTGVKYLSKICPSGTVWHYTAELHVAKLKPSDQYLTLMKDSYNISICNFRFFKFWFRGKDFGSRCTSSWSLLYFYF